MNLRYKTLAKIAVWAGPAALTFWLGYAGAQAGHPPGAARKAISLATKPGGKPGAPTEDANLPNNTQTVSGPVPDPDCMARFYKALAQPVETVRRREWLLAIDAAGPVELKAAAGMVGHAGELLPMMLAERWASADPAGFVRFMVPQFGIMPPVPDYLGRAAEAWARQDMEAAKAFFESGTRQGGGDRIHDLTMADKLADAILRVLTEQDPGAATAWATEGEKRERLLPHLASVMVKTLGSEEAMRWLDGVAARPESNDLMMRELFRTVSGSVAQSRDLTAEKAVAFLTEQRGRPWWKEEEDLPAFLSAVPEHRITLLMDTLMALAPDPATREHSRVAVAASQWALHDQEGAFTWMETHGDSPHFDTVALALVETMTATPLVGALELRPYAARIKDPEKRAEALQRLDEWETQMGSMLRDIPGGAEPPPEQGQPSGN